MNEHNQDPGVGKALLEIHRITYAVNWRSLPPEGKPGFFKDAALSLVRLVDEIKDKLTSSGRYILSEDQELSTLKNHKDELIKAAFALSYGSLYSVDISGSDGCLGLSERSSFLWDYLSDPSPRVRGVSLYALNRIVSKNINLMTISDENVLRTSGLLGDTSSMVQVYAAALFTEIYSRFPYSRELPDSFTSDTLDRIALKIMGLPLTGDRVLDVPLLFSISKLLAEPNHLSLLDTFDRTPGNTIPYRGFSIAIKKAALARLAEYSIDPNPEVGLRAAEVLANFAKSITLRPMLEELADETPGSSIAKIRVLSSILRENLVDQPGKARLPDDIVLAPPASLLMRKQIQIRRLPGPPLKRTN